MTGNNLSKALETGFEISNKTLKKVASLSCIQLDVSPLKPPAGGTHSVMQQNGFELRKKP